MVENLLKKNNSTIVFNAFYGTNKKLGLEDLKDLHIFITQCHHNYITDLPSILYSVITENNRGINANVNVYFPKEHNRINLLSQLKHENIVVTLFDEKSLFNIGEIKVSFEKTVFSAGNYTIKLANGENIISYSGGQILDYSISV